MFVSSGERVSWEENQSLCLEGWPRNNLFIVECIWKSAEASALIALFFFLFLPKGDCVHGCSPKKHVVLILDIWESFLSPQPRNLTAFIKMITVGSP